MRIIILSLLLDDTKMQTLSTALECEDLLCPEQLLAAPVYDRLLHYHFAQQEGAQLNSHSEETENCLPLLMSLSCAALHATP